MKTMFSGLAVLVGMLVVQACAEEAWITDFSQAKKAAAEKQLPILADFSGSDWCGWCIKLDKEVFSQDNFKKFAKDNLVLFLADYPRKKKQPEELQKQNAALAEKYGIEGFPTVLLLDGSGQVIAKTGYQPGGPAKYVEHLKGLLEKVSVKDKAKDAVKK